MEPYYTPQATPEAQHFNLPEFKLPPIEQFGKGADNVFTKTDSGRVPRKPTFQEMMEMDAAKFAREPNLLKPIGEYSAKDSQGFKNPNVAYDPTVNMADTYAKYDPTTWGDSFDKMWDVTTNNFMSGTQNLWQGLKEGFSEGRVSAIWDNKYSKELAQLTDDLEKNKPLYFREGEEGSTNAWLKQLLPSAGYVVSSVAEMAIQTAGLTLGGAVVGAVTGEGLGAVPGAVFGFGAAMAKNIQTTKNAITGISNAAKAISTLSTANKIKTGAQLLGRGLLAANGEAALNAQMASRSALERRKADYFNQTGQYLSGDELNKAEEEAKKTGDVTMSLNLPLIAASNLFQFGNLVRGKAAPSIMEKLAFKINPITGKAVAKNTLAFVGGRFLAETAAEGGEEFAQGVIEDATVNYFDSKLKNRQNYLATFADSVYKRATSGEGMSDFLGGALLGGISNAVDLRSYNTVHKNTANFVNSYNTTTGAYFDALGNAVRTNTNLRDAIKKGDSEAVAKASRDGIINMVNAHAKAGSLEAFSSTLDAMDQMDNQEFITTFGVNVSPEEQATIMSGLTAEYKTAAKIREDIDTAFQVNPFESDNWFQKKINEFKSDFNVDKEAAANVWDSFKDILTSNVIRYNDTANLQNRLYESGAGTIPEFAAVAGINIPEAVQAYEDNLDARAAANLPSIGGFDSTREKALSAKLKSLNSPSEKYGAILDHLDNVTPGAKETIKRYNREAAAASVLLAETKKLQSKAGQRKAIKKIMDYQRLYEAAVNNIVAPASPVAAQVAATPAPAPATPPPATPSVPPAVTIAPASAPAPAPVVAPVAPTATQVPISPGAEAAARAAARQNPAVPVLDTTVTEDEEEFPELVFPSTPSGAEDVSGVYGEGITEDSPAQTQTQVPPVNPVKTPDVVDGSLPRDIQVDEAQLSQAIKDLAEGESIPLNTIGVDATTPDGEKINIIERKKEGLVGTTTEGNSVPLQPEPLLGLEVTGADDSVNVYAQANNLTPDQRSILDQLLIKSAIISCS